MNEQNQALKTDAHAPSVDIHHARAEGGRAAVALGTRLGDSPEGRATVRDWGLVMMIFYGTITAVLWTFAAFGLVHGSAEYDLAVSNRPFHSAMRRDAAHVPQVSPTHGSDR